MEHHSKLFWDCIIQSTPWFHPAYFPILNLYAHEDLSFSSKVVVGWVRSDQRMLQLKPSWMELELGLLLHFNIPRAEINWNPTEFMVINLFLSSAPVQQTTSTGWHVDCLLTSVQARQGRGWWWWWGLLQDNALSCVGQYIYLCSWNTLAPLYSPYSSSYGQLYGITNYLCGHMHHRLTKWHVHSTHVVLSISCHVLLLLLLLLVVLNPLHVVVGCSRGKQNYVDKSNTVSTEFRVL